MLVFWGQYQVCHASGKKVEEVVFTSDDNYLSKVVGPKEGISCLQHGEARLCYFVLNSGLTESFSLWHSIYCVKFQCAVALKNVSSKWSLYLSAECSDIV